MYNNGGGLNAKKYFLPVNLSRDIRCVGVAKKKN